MQPTQRIICMLILLLSMALVQAQNYPYPQQQDFPNCIKPNNVSQTAMDDSVASLYDAYKSTYLKSYLGNQYYIEANGEGPGGNSSLTVSEAHGYGMIIMALMAGHDASAQTQFDGMYRFFEDNPSEINDNLMSWIGNIASDAATDGDMDIAYALLLADKQWGSTGTINYLAEAQRVITQGIKADEMSASTKRTMLGDWDDDDQTTRTSDWMTGHMHAFAVATGDNFWNQAADTVYSLISKLVASDAPTTGLLPDFVDGGTPYPDYNAGGTGEANGDEYWYNACRDPWRIALDYAHNGTAAAKTTTSKMLSWLRSDASGDPENIMAGYTLNGSAINNYNDIVFQAPFAAGMITDVANQAFLNATWGWIVGESGDDAYAHALNLLSQLLITGNWWAPNNTPTPVCDDGCDNLAPERNGFAINQQGSTIRLAGIQEDVTVRFYSVSGKELYATNVSAQSGSANLLLPSTLAKGIVMMQVTSPTMQQVKRLRF